MKYLSIIIIILFCIEYSYAQKKTAVWYFGENAGMDFKSGEPVALMDGALFTREGCASICDFDGNILFYTDGVTVWNKNHEVMENGNGLDGDFSSTQSSIIIPKPGSNHLYYIFTVQSIYSNDRKLSYSVVDIDKNDGLGEVEDKNIELLSQVTERITATKKMNGIDYWVVVHKNNSNSFYTFMITQDGISSSPIISNVGVEHNEPISNWVGYMRFSPTGKYLALAIQYPLSLFELFSFDKSTGILSNPITFNNYDYAYGLEFSPDDSKLYFGKINFLPQIYQVDLNAGTPEKIINSKVLLNTSSYAFGALELGPDDKIYIAKDFSGNLDVINNPDKRGDSCDYTVDGFYLGGRVSRIGLPNNITVYRDVDFSALPLCYGDTTWFYPEATSTDSVLWDFGDSISGINNWSNDLYSWHIYSVPGDYNVSLTLWFSGNVITVKHLLQIVALPFVNLGPDTSFCSNSPYLLHAGSGYDSYLWQDGFVDSVYLVDTSGIYWVSVENECGTVSDTVEVDYTESFQIDLGSDTLFCYGNSIPLFPGSNYFHYLWQDGSTDSLFVADASGTYWVQVTDSSGCKATDSITIDTFPGFDFSIGNDTTICFGDYVFLYAPPGFESYQWQDGSGNTSYIADTSGYYWLEVTDTNNCVARDSMLLTANKVPDNILGNDTLFCKDGTFTLQTNHVYEQYFWNNGSNDSVLTTSQPGKYWVTVFDTLGCSGSDTIQLDYFPTITLEINATGQLCKDDSVILQAISNYNNYLWQDSSQNQTYIAKDSGIYWVKVTTPCETKSDSITLDACSSIWIPNVFTPNNDGYNDQFGAVAKNIIKFKLVIFNRWGQELKTLNNINEKWDGTYRGQKAAQGTYFWVADYEQVERDGSIKHIRLQGSVTLIR